ncbi:MAG: GTPase HflX [Desulfobacteraceae bacterium]|nr:GTPase HflX [Desulfobacteraceae bacterium]
MDKVYGKTGGLKASQQKRLQNLYRRHVSSHEIISHELTRQISSISREIKRQVALLMTRKGEVAYIVVGDSKHIWIPALSRGRLGAGRLKGLRCIHTHLNGEPLSREDVTDLVLIGLDLMVCVQVNEKGIPGPITYANILPTNRDGKGWIVNRVPDIGQLNVDFLEMIQSLEEELERARVRVSVEKKERALLVGVTTGPRWQEEESLDELEDLALSDSIEVIGRVVHHIKKVDPRFLIRKGKLSELALQCLQTGSNLLIFNNELTPAQVKGLTDFTELKIIDRSQLILDIFARRAVTREGKIQVELAQLKYLLPRLATKNTAMSRLTGGIGGRGPGETKLEINRRRVRERIARLNRELMEIKRQREERRRLRNVRRLPVISIVGYTNAGKSTLLNTLTHSHVGVNNRLFETLDPSSRRLRFPREREAIITDTVGFIRNLPESLMEAFAATLEELHDAELLLHVVDATSPRLEKQIKTVEEILSNLDLNRIPILLVLNKTDLLSPKIVDALSKNMGGIAISALHPPSLSGLIERVEVLIWGRSSI